MADFEDEQQDETLEVTDDPKSSAAVLSALKKSERDFNAWQAECDSIDDIYSRRGSGEFLGYQWDFAWSDVELDLFWASFEVLKPAVYAKPPKAAVAPMFSDSDPVKDKTAELLERVSSSALARTHIDDVMIQTRDDLLFSGRGVIWLRYETDEKGGGQRVCVEHVDRKDFRHESARYWCEVGWVAKRSWLTRKELRKRFSKTSGDAYKDVKLHTPDREDREDNNRSSAKKGAVWEVWHKADNCVYWVAEGVDVLLDEGEPHLKLNDFFPCPKPAYATLSRRSLIPVPDYARYRVHFAKISTLTGRIYLLLDKIKMKGLVPAGGDIADAVQAVIQSEDDEMIVGVPSAALTGAGPNGFVTWMPLAELAQAITGLIEARSQLIQDFYQLSGISDIMRGATEAEETLGAQQLKSQFGSVRVREKIDELQRIAADVVRITSEIVSEEFSRETILEMAQMEVPTKREIEKRVKDVESAAEEEMKALRDKAQQMIEQSRQQMQDEQPDQQQAQQAAAQFEQAQQQLVQKYAAMLSDAETQIPIEDIMELLRDDRARGFTFEIESDSTIMTDEIAEKQSRNEFLTQFNNSSQALLSLAAMGEQGAELAGGMLKFALAPYRTGRQLDSLIDNFIKAAPQMAAKAAGQEGEGEELAAANAKLAEAEMAKARAQMAQVEANSALGRADQMRKYGELQQKARDAETKAELEVAKLRQQLDEANAKAALTEAQINKLQADTAKILASIGLDERKQNLEEYKTASDEQARRVDQAMTAENQQSEQQFRERSENRADQQAVNSERQADRQMSLAERSASQEQN